MCNNVLLKRHSEEYKPFVSNNSITQKFNPFKDYLQNDSILLHIRLKYTQVSCIVYCKANDHLRIGPRKQCIISYFKGDTRVERTHSTHSLSFNVFSKLYPTFYFHMVLFADKLEGILSTQTFKRKFLKEICELATNCRYKHVKSYWGLNRWYSPWNHQIQSRVRAWCSGSTSPASLVRAEARPGGEGAEQRRPGPRWEWRRRPARPGSSVFTARCGSPAFKCGAWGGWIIVDKILFRILIYQLFGVSVHIHTINIINKVFFWCHLAFLISVGGLCFNYATSSALGIHSWMLLCGCTI